MMRLLFQLIGGARFGWFSFGDERTGQLLRLLAREVPLTSVAAIEILRAFAVWEHFWLYLDLVEYRLVHGLGLLVRLVLFDHIQLDVLDVLLCSNILFGSRYSGGDKRVTLYFEDGGSVILLAFDHGQFADSLAEYVILFAMLGVVLDQRLSLLLNVGQQAVEVSIWVCFAGIFGYRSLFQELPDVDVIQLLIVRDQCLELVELRLDFVKLADEKHLGLVRDWFTWSFHVRNSNILQKSSIANAATN